MNGQSDRPDIESGDENMNAEPEAAETPVDEDDTPTLESLQAKADEAMAQLPEDYRRIIELVQVQDYALADAAEQMERSYEATKKLYARALARLRELMELEEDGD